MNQVSMRATYNRVNKPRIFILLAKCFQLLLKSVSKVRLENKFSIICHYWNMQVWGKKSINLQPVILSTPLQNIRHLECLGDLECSDEYYRTTHSVLRFRLFFMTHDTPSTACVCKSLTTGAKRKRNFLILLTLVPLQFLLSSADLKLYA